MKLTTGHTAMHHNALFVWRDHCSSLEEADGSPIPSWMGKIFIVSCVAGPLPGLGGIPLPQQRFSRGIPKGFLLGLLQQIDGALTAVVTHFRKKST